MSFRPFTISRVFAFGANDEPTVLKFLLGHPDPIVSDDQEVVGSKVINFRVVCVGIMTVLEKLTNRSSGTSYLLTSEHVNRSSSSSKFRHS